ncbi:MAG: hypothetical protein LBE79_07885 [Tannerella sp.]|jgi:hypothetical protein|nr:hypothetical protein [Tannerella sp.]
MRKYAEKYGPHLFAVILFIGLSLTYMAPIVLEDKELFQNDIISSQAWGKDLRDYHQQTGEYAFWSNSMFSGMPANYTFMPPISNLFNYFDHIIFSVFPMNMALIFLYLIGFYIFLFSIGCKPKLSVIGSIAYTFASYSIIIIVAGHVNKALVMATMAPMIGGIILTYRKKYLPGIIITLIFTGLNVLWEHHQISYYQLIIIIVLAVTYLIYAIQEKTVKDFLKSSAILLVVALIAVLPSFGKLYSTADYTKETMRGGAVLQTNAEGKKESTGLDIDYAYMWSYGKSETMTLLIPNFNGACSGYNIGTDSEFYRFLQKAGLGAQATQASKQAPMYWGDQPGTSGPVYMGAIICFLFILGLFVVKGPEKWWMLIATIIAIMMSWGRHFPLLNDFLFYHLPLYNKFRVPAMTLVIPQITMAALAILALKQILEDKGKRDQYIKPLYISFGITGGLCLIFALIGGSLMSFSGTEDRQIQSPELLAAIISDRKSMLISDAWRSFFFIAAVAGFLWYYLRKSLKITYLISIIGILIFIDLWMVDKRFLNFDSFLPKKTATEFTTTPADQLILKDQDPHYRVLNLTSSTFQESRTSNFHKSIGGYSPAKLRRYQDIIDYYFSSGSLNENILNMLNAKYFIYPTQQQGPQVHFNENALGNVWFVKQVHWVNSPDEEIAALKDFDPSQIAVIDAEWKEKVPNWEKLQFSETDSVASIQLKDYINPGYLVYESSSTQRRLAVFSEVFYKTWKAYIDGLEVPLIRVNYILRGLEVPAGNHTIELKCTDEIYLQGAKISLIASIIAGLVLLSLFGYGIRRIIRK